MNPPPEHARFAAVVCCDSGHLPYASYTLHSLARHNPERQFDLVLCSMEPVELPPVLKRIGVKPLVVGKMGDTTLLKKTRLPVNAYLRLWLPKYLQSRYERLLYLDTDIMVQGGDASVLFHVNLGRHPLAAVLERPLWGKRWHHAKDFKAVGLKRAPYFNSGVLLIDVERFNDQAVLDGCLDAASRFNDVLHYHDQSLLNIALYENWAELSPIWNWQWVSHKAMLEPVAQPNFLHMFGANKPWNDAAGTIPARIRYEYKLFLDEHFPGSMQGIGPVRRPLTSGRSIAALSWRNVRSAPALHRYLRRFPNENDTRL